VRTDRAGDRFGRLDGDVALVTGAGSGVGRAVAVELAAAGALLIVTSRSEASARTTAGMVDQAGKLPCEVMAVDVTSGEARRRLADHIGSVHGRLDILVANAGVDLSHEPSIDALTDDEWDHVLETNLSSVFRLLRCVLPMMQAGASIITIGSANSLVARANAAAYVASKGGLLQFTRALAVDLAARGIRANCVCPGNISTPLTESFLAASETPATLRAQYAASAPMNRLGTAEEVATCVRFLASREASFVTGATLAVDGGLTVI
jgi:NAD(P)-dependent dehydrogenase (short-subunit alcohol dehydrogenase family)